MTSPYVGSNYSWSDSIAKKPLKQTDVLDDTLGQRFGVAGNGTGQQPPQMPGQPPQTSPVLKSAPPAGTPVGSTPMPPSTGVLPSPKNPFRPSTTTAPQPFDGPPSGQTPINLPSGQPPSGQPFDGPPSGKQPIGLPDAQPFDGAPSGIPPVGLPSAPPAAPPNAPPVHGPANGMPPSTNTTEPGSHATDQNLNWMYGVNADGTPMSNSTGGGQGPLALPPGTQPGTYSNIDSGWSQDPMAAAAFNQHAFSNGLQVGSKEWWDDMNAWAGSPAGQAARTGSPTGVSGPTTTATADGGNGGTSGAIPGVSAGAMSRASDVAAAPPPAGVSATGSANAPASIVGTGPPGNPTFGTEAKAAFGNQPVGTPSTPPPGTTAWPASAGQPYGQGWHSDLGYYVDSQGVSWDTTTHQQLTGSDVDRRNAVGPQTPAATAPPIAAPSTPATPPASIPSSGTFTPPTTPPRVPDIPANPLSTQAAGVASNALDNPNPYTQDVIQSLWNNTAAGLDANYNTANTALQGNLASRGITDSTFGGEKEQQLIGQTRTAKEQALSSLMEQAANANSEARSRAISDANSLAQADLARRFGINDRTNQNAQFDWSKIMDVNQSDQQSQLAWQSFLEWMAQQGKAA